MKYGWYGASCVKLPIQAPPIPRLKRSTGRMQQDDAASAPMIPPIASSFWPLSNEELPACSLAATDPMANGVSPMVLSFCIHHPPTSCSQYRSKMGLITEARAETLSIGELS